MSQKYNNDVVLSSRVRFARNLPEYPFASQMDETSAKEIIAKVSSAADAGFKLTDFRDLSAAEAGAYVEKHRVSPAFIESPLPHALLEKEEDDLYIMLCEEDHIRLQCIKSGFALDDAYRTACKADDMLNEKVNYAWNEKLGYLTHCPTNLGTGMRASVMVFLPALTEYKMISELSSAVGKVGLTIRGMYGEGSRADGAIYQISNRITLGVSEEDTIKKMNDIIAQVIKLEERQRSILKSDNGDRLTDRVYRSLGVMRSAYMLSSAEFMSLYSDVKLGACLGLLPGVDAALPDRLMLEIQPATLTMSSGAADEHARDIARAEHLRKALAGVM